MSQNIKAVIFDLDGTLIDTEKIYRIAIPKAMNKLGFPYDDEKYLMLGNLSRAQILKNYYEWYGEGFDYAVFKAERKKFFDAYINEHGIQRKPGAIELLTELKKRGIRTAIATATDKERSTQYMQMTGLENLIDDFICAAMVGEGKPSPKIYLNACERLGLKPSECLAIEDAPTGVESAFYAGCRTILIPDQYPIDDITIERAYRKYSSLNEILDNLDELVR